MKRKYIAVLISITCVLAILLASRLRSYSLDQYGAVSAEELIGYASRAGGEGGRASAENFISGLYRQYIESGIDASNQPGWTGDINNPVDFSRIGETPGNTGAAGSTGTVMPKNSSAVQNPVGGKSASKPNYSHDYPELSDETVEALGYFTKDGEPDSAYVNIASDSGQNVVKGSLLNLSRTNKEDMKISFVSENRVDSEWIFHEWESEDDFELELTSTLIEDNGEYEGYLLSFAQPGTLSGNDVTYKVNMGVSDNEIFVYRRDNGKYSEMYRGMTDGEGMLELHPDELGEYFLSETDIIAEEERKAEEARKAEEKKKAEEERLKKEEAEKAAEAEAAKETAEAPSPASDVLETVLPEKKEPNVKLYVLCIVGILLGGSIGALVYKFLRK